MRYFSFNLIALGCLACTAPVFCQTLGPEIGAAAYAHVRQGFNDKQHHQDQAAADQFRAVVHLAPSNELAHWVLAGDLMDLWEADHFRVAELQQAVKQYRLMVRQYPKGNYHANLAGALTEAGDLAGAEGEYRQSLHFIPVVPANYSELCGVYEAWGKLLERDHQNSAALQQYELALRYAPDYDARSHAMRLKIKVTRLLRAAQNRQEAR